MPPTDDAPPAIRFAIATTDHVTLENELIVFSAKHQQYFGIEGAGRMVWAALDQTRQPMSQPEIIEFILAKQHEPAGAVTLIQEALRTLLDLGVLREA